MTLKKWSFLFYTTLLVGMLGSLISSIVIGQETLQYGLIDFGVGLIGSLIAGLMFSVISQMGFFAYLTVNYMGLILFRRKSLWQGVQMILIVFVFVDVIILRHDMFAPNAPITGYIVWPLILLIYALAVAFFKVRATNASAWVPTLFFMFVVTVLEWVPALRENNSKSMLLMLIPLLLCNTWQIMQLHRLVQKKKSPA